MPRRFADYLNRLTRRNIQNEESRPYTMNATIDINQWHYNTLRDQTSDIAASLSAREILEAAMRNMSTREVMEVAETPESMLRLVRMSMPNLTANELVEERPMDSPPEIRTGLYSRSLWEHDMDNDSMYREYTPVWNSNKTITWNWGDKLGGHVEFRRGKIIRVKRYCKI